MNRLLRSLVLACGLLVALPPMWCCMLYAHLQTASDTSPDSPKTPCCPCCKLDAPAQRTPAKKPAPEPGSCQLCLNRQALLPSKAVHQPNIDWAVVAFLPPPVCGPFLVQTGEEAVSVVHPLTHELYLFKCVWLC
jgi:hypothetical protein